MRAYVCTILHTYGCTMVCSLRVYYGVLLMGVQGYRRTNLQMQVFYFFAMGVLTYTYVPTRIHTGILHEF